MKKSIPFTRSHNISANVVILALSCLFSFVVQAAMPNVSPAQIEQFKKLPKSQQEALAKSMGIDLSAITGGFNSSDDSELEDALPQQYSPREEELDEDIDEKEDEWLADEQKELEPFGYNVFSNAPLTFAPAIDIAVPESYLIGPGDRLSIQVFGKENEEFEFPISREGTITLPKLGPFRVAGMTFAEVKLFLNDQIKKKVIGVQAVVTLSKLRSIRVFVLGDAYKPGPYVLSALSSMTHAIFASGGINDIGSLRNVQLKRAGKLVATLDLYDLLINGDSTNDLLLKSGDVLFVAPVGKRITVEGEVTRPAIYEITEKDSFASVLKMAGGLLPTAFPSMSRVERYNENSLRSVLSVNLSQKQDLAKKVKGGDHLKVMKSSEQYKDSVTLFGAVTSPGKYQWTPELRISDVLPSIHASLLDSADLAYGIVVREKDVARNIEVHQFSLFNIASDKTSPDNFLLKPHDNILIFSNTNKPSKDFEFSDLALTSQELKYIEKYQAEEKQKEKDFWLKMDPSKQVEEEDISVLSSVSLSEFTGAEEEPVFDIREFNYFSRERLLAPVITKLKQQAASGEPLQIIEVVGAVKFPGLYPLTVNSKVHSVVKAAGGLLESAYLEKAEITRNAISNSKVIKTTHAFPLKNALLETDSEKPSFGLHSKDRLNILTIPSWQDNHEVELRGEFLFPGKYTIKRGETLAELIERVGGYTEYAYTKSSVFTREKLKLIEKRNVEKMAENLRQEIASKSLSSESQIIDYKQAKVLLADLTKVEPLGRLVVDLPKVIQGSEHDVILEDGDFIYVPTKQNSINVIGEVQLATAHMFKSTLTVDDYISISGGYKNQADEDRVYVIKANGGVFIPESEGWFGSSKNKLEPGDSIVIPTDTDYMPNLKLWATATQIIYQSAVAVAAVAGV